jgi:ribonucleotide reductase alpha subunit
MKMGINYDSELAYKLDKQIFETIYHGSVTASCELAKQLGTYQTYEGSPFSEGKLQFHLWGLNENNLSNLWDWKSLINDVKQYGMRNSLLTSIMPTASTSQILGNTESVEPITSNIYNRETQAGSFVVINKFLMKDLIALGLWNTDIKNKIIYYGGSVQYIDEIPQNIKDLYKTVWELPQRAIIDHALCRQPFIDQSQSMNLYFESPSYQKVTSAHYYGWKRGIKTGMYYLRSRSAVDPKQFSLDINDINKIKDDNKRKRSNDDNTYAVCKFRRTETGKTECDGCGA